MSRKRSIAMVGAAGLLAITAVAPALASSHREAPLISGDPAADNTDLYAFVSPDKPDTVTVIANYEGFQEPAGGPNFYPFDPKALYWIKADNNGDGMPDVTYTFQFTTNVANPNSFLYSGYGPIPAADANVTQTYTVTRNGTAIGTDLSVPPPNIGPRTTPKYADLAATGIHPLDNNGQVFAGQRDDPFFVDLGAIFDLGGLRPFNQAHLIPLKTAKGQDDLAAFNVNSIAIQLPKSDLSNDGKDVTDAKAANAVVGLWAGASRQVMTTGMGTASPAPSEMASPAASGETSGTWQQVSRLGNPLINEVIIPVGEKDAWNAADPVNDSAYAKRYTDPELAAVINTIYPTLPDADTTGRGDLSLILGQGVPTLNQTNTGDTLYDELRLNMGVPPTAKPSRLGALDGDLAGFPNGRRLADDVVDIELRAVADGYGSFLANAFGLKDLSPNNTIGDGCDMNDQAFLPAFPYVAQPWQGYTGGDYRHVPCAPNNQ